MNEDHHGDDARRDAGGQRHHSVAFSPDGRAVTAGSDGTARISDLRSAQELATLRGHTGSIMSVAVSFHSALVATASADGIGAGTAHTITKRLAQHASALRQVMPHFAFSLSLHHWEHPEAAVPELARNLRPGGRVYIYDFPFAPFDKLADTARARSVLNGRSPEQTPIRTGIPFLRCVRYVMSS